MMIRRRLEEQLAFPAATRTVTGCAACALATLAYASGVAAVGGHPGQVASPTPRIGAALLEWNGSVCMFGGFEGDTPLASVECYEHGSGEWTRQPPMPTARGLLAGASVRGDAYVIGGTSEGFDKLGVVERLAAREATWSSVTPLPTPRNALSATAVSGFIYVVGGWGVDADGRARDFETVERYDPERDRWEQRAPLPTPRSHMGSVAVGERIFTFGGWMMRAGGHVALDNVEVYDARSDLWSRGASMPTPRWLPSAVAIDGKIWVSGGWTVGPDGSRATVASTRVEVFDPETNRWARDNDLSVPRSGHSSAVVAGHILLLGGASRWPPRADDGSMPTRVETYTPGDFAALPTLSATTVEAAASGSGAEFRDGGAQGTVVAVEQPFGNLITDLVPGDLLSVGVAVNDRFALYVGGERYLVTYAKDFSDVARGEWVAFPHASGALTLARNFASAAETCGCTNGTTIFVTSLPER